MKRFECPKCGYVVRAIARAAGHICKKNGKRVTTMKEAAK